MRRAFPLMLLLVALIVVPTAHAASAAKVIMDCTDDEVLQGHYTQKELANALAKLSADSAEYTNCAAVIHNAQLALAAGAKSGGSGSTKTGSGSGSSGSTAPSGTSTTPGKASSPATSGNAPGAFGGFSGYPSNPAQGASPTERNAIQDARTAPTSVQRTELASTPIPGPLIVALAAGGVGLLALLLLDLRRRVLARRG